MFKSQYCSCSRYYLEPSSPLKSIKLSSSQSNMMSRGNSDESSPSSSASSMKTSASSHSALNSFSTATVQDNRLPNQQSQNKLNGNNFEFFADFDKANSLFSNNFDTIPSTAAAQQTANFQASSGDMNANFADFENNKIYNAVGECTTQLHIKFSFSEIKSILKCQSCTFLSLADMTNPMNILKANNQNSLLARPNQPSATDKYAALKMLDDEFKEATKQQDETVQNHVEETTTCECVLGFGYCQFKKETRSRTFYE